MSILESFSHVIMKRQAEILVEISASLLQYFGLSCVNLIIEGLFDPAKFMQYARFSRWYLVTPGNPQRCDSMIAKKGPFNCGFVYLESSCSGYHFSCEVL